MRRITSLMVFSCSVMLATACTSDKIVYRDAQAFAAPPAAAASFVGYSDTATKKTVCGSCHVEKQALWATAKHASAWKDLQASGGSQSYCEPCHTVSQNGNAATTDVGYQGSKDARYHDVQCESCHGAGLTHVTSPSLTNQPLASIKADTGLKNGCGECHSGTHNPFVDEWRISGHASTWDTSHNSTDPYCQGCHTGQGALTTWGIKSNFVEAKDATPQNVVCAVCHDPHGSPNTAQLRFPINTSSTETNLCMKCHQRRGTFQDAIAQGRNTVHSPEGPTLLGQAGWFPPGMSASDSIISSHGSPAKNPNLCATCHVQKFAGTDPVTKASVNSTGHRFLATPCVSANGLPTKDQTCTPTSMTFRSCLGTGCHATEALARNAFNTATARVTLLTNEANRLITLVKAGPKAAECTFSTTKPYTTCMGIQFNISVTTKVGGIVHNPFLLEQLMIASINQLKKDYGVTAAADIELTPLLKKSSSLAGGTR
jgi:predicted CXXCH cytochrome family protein